MLPEIVIGPIVKIAKSKAEWQQLLSAESFRVLRQADTERPFLNRMHNQKLSGYYYCAGCDLPLFSSEHKFESGTGWPSFWQPIVPEVIERTIDYALIFPRTEVHCARCAGHQGHLFSDGPPPTGNRYCINAAALMFRAA